MGSKHWQFMEISRRIKDDPKAGLLLEEFLDACFATVPLPGAAPGKTERDPQACAVHIAVALAQLNAYLKNQRLVPEGIAPPGGLGLNAWAEEITLQILANGPH